ncbi:MAG: L,D-transpeptidase family protein [Planctomycetaceae bacterium]
MRRRRRMRTIRNGVCACLVLVMAVVGSWKQGWLPIELVEAETGKLLALRPRSEAATTSEIRTPPREIDGDQAARDSIVLTGQTEPDPPIARQPPARSVLTPRNAAQPDSDITVQESTAALLTAHQNVLASIDQKLGQGDYLIAHRQLSELYWKHPPLRTVIKKRLDKTARSIYSAPQPHYINPYEVQPGDQLRLIARKYEVPWEYLAKLNRTDPKRIRPGQKLKVIKGPFSAVVSLSRFELTLHAHGYYVHQYQVGIGKPGTTPTGTFTVKEKLRNPTYYGPDGVVAAENPENPLGERWLGLGDGYGIHGTVEPSSIGRSLSRGCVRMYAADVAEAYDLLEVGSEVIIRR